MFVLFFICAIRRTKGSISFSYIVYSNNSNWWRGNKALSLHVSLQYVHVMNIGWWPREWDHTCKQPMFLCKYLGSALETGRGDQSRLQLLHVPSTDQDAHWTPGASLWRFSGHIHLGCDPLDTGIINPIWPGNDLGTPGGAEGHEWREGRLGHFA